tara:strand:+ start:8296 stop:9372 length:1077 start_codon:yes stop_codon:yes gene_type:complete
MAIDANIVNFGQSNPTMDAIQGFGQSVAGAITANKQSGLADNRKQAAGLIRQAFSDESDKVQTRALLSQAEQLDPEFTLGMVNKVRGGQSKTGLESRRLDLLEQNAKTATDKEARLALGTVSPIPQELVSNLSPEVASTVSATFEAAGGGSEGLKAVAKVMDTASEQERRNSSPRLISASFPNATKAETVQLQASMDAAKTTEAGLSEAKSVREAQRTAKKAQSFQRRGIQLLDGILANDQLGDVLGSIEGNIDFRFTDSESELIDDIDEVGSILTADNLNLMSGVLSESDIAILRQLAGGGLKRTRSEPRFRKDVQDLRDKLGSSLVVTADDVESERNNTNNNSQVSNSGITFSVEE